MMSVCVRLVMVGVIPAIVVGVGDVAVDVDGFGVDGVGVIADACVVVIAVGDVAVCYDGVVYACNGVVIFVVAVVVTVTVVFCC